MTKKIDALINGVSAKTLKEFCTAKANTTGGDAEFIPLPDGVIKRYSANRDIFRGGSHKRFESVEEVGYFKHLGMFVFFVMLRPGHELSERSCRRLQFDFACDLLKYVDWTDQQSFTGWLTHKGVMMAPKVSEGLFVFADSAGNFRFSYIENIKSAADEKRRRFRRFTFYVTSGKDSASGTSDGRSNRTFIDRMKMPWSNRAALSEAFSVQALSDEFFEEYKRIYEKFVGFCMKPSVKKQFTDRGFSDDKFIRDYVKKLMGRLVFLHFLEKKLWLGVPEGGRWGEGDANYLRNLFNAKKVQKAFKDNFLDKVLEPLFFGSLNERRPDDVADAILSPNKVEKVRIPYLNGGLFEGDFDRPDGHRGIDSTNIPFPDDYFEDLFDTFDSFNFTIDENGPEDAEVGVDPEMLSRIFENLLEDNKDKGAFYTPKEIVDYMCKESLIAYLGETPAVRELVENYSSNDGLADKFSDGEKAALLEKLSKVKICDPAIGSGAFPMGMLAILARLRLRLEGKEENSANIVALKKEIIQNNIYGVDIEAGAVDIARLRFWLSIVVDENEPIPLPNLDYKIMQGNSLLESYGGVDLSHVLDGGGTTVKTRGKNKGKKKAEFWQTEFAFDAKAAVDEIVRDKAQLFDTTDHEVKARLVARINGNVKAYISHKLPSSSPYAATIPDGPNPNFMLWHLYFSEVFKDGGFDIVIGNPPYISAKEYSKIISDDEKSLLKRTYKTAHGACDVYILFFELCMNVIKDGGVLNLITPNKYLSAKYGKALREFFVENDSVRKVVDVSQFAVFKKAKVYPVVSLLKKESQIDFFEVAKVQSLEELSKLEKYNLLPSSVLKSCPDYIWGVLLSDKLGVLPRVLKSGIKFEDIAQINATSTAGEAEDYGKYFVDKQPKGGLKVVNTGTIDPYCNLWGLRALVHQHKKFLTPYLPLTQSGVNARRVAIYKSPKIIFAKIGVVAEAFLDADGSFASVNTNCVYNPSKNYTLEYLVGLCNSKLFTCIYEMLFGALKMNGGYMQFQAPQLRVFPIHEKNKIMQDKVSILVAQILDAKKSNPQADTSPLEAKIDDLVYDLYGLTDEERAIVDPERFGKAKCEKGGTDVAQEPAAAAVAPQDDSDSDDDARD